MEIPDGPCKCVESPFKLHMEGDAADCGLTNKGAVSTTKLQGTPNCTEAQWWFCIVEKDQAVVKNATLPMRVMVPRVIALTQECAVTDVTKTTAFCASKKLFTSKECPKGLQENVCHVKSGTEPHIQCSDLSSIAMDKAQRLCTQQTNAHQLTWILPQLQ